MESDKVFWTCQNVAMTEPTKKRLKTAALIVSCISITWFLVSLNDTLDTIRARMWLISSVKMPLHGAALIIQDDLREGNYQRAKFKVDALVEEVENFHHGTQLLAGPGLANLAWRLHEMNKAQEDPGDPRPQLKLHHQDGATRYELRLLASADAQNVYQIGFFDQETNTRIGLAADRESPKYELRLVADANSPDSHKAGLYDQKTGLRIGLAETVQGGVMSAANAAETLTALWHPSGTVVAFNDRATKHTLELYVYAIRDGTPVRLSVPDYVQNALGRLGALETDIHCLSTPLHWQEDVLTVKLHFSVSTPDKGLTRHEAMATLHLEGDRLRLQSVEVQQPVNFKP
jgi:hypothetical protein